MYGTKYIIILKMIFRFCRNASRVLLKIFCLRIEHLLPILKLCVTPCTRCHILFSLFWFLLEKGFPIVNDQGLMVKTYNKHSVIVLARLILVLKVDVYCKKLNYFLYDNDQLQIDCK